MQPPEPPATAPKPLGATFSSGTLVCTVNFDQPLVPGVSAPGNWQPFANITAGPRSYAPLAPPVVAGAAVTFACADTGGTVGVNRVRYLAAPPDVFGLVGGLPALLFTQPMIVIP